MNYLKEINAFFDHMECYPLSASAVTLWHALMHINNKTRWRKSFTAAAPVLRLKSGLTASSFKRARTELNDKGYIVYKSRGGGQAPVYRMISLVLDPEDRAAWHMESETVAQAGQRVNGDEDVCDAGARRLREQAVKEADRDADRGMDECANQHADQGMDREAGQAVSRGTDRGADQRTNQMADQNTVPLIKQDQDETKPNEIKQEATTKTTDAFVFYQENFGVVSPFVTDAMLNWVHDVGEELVLDAMKRALERGKSNWGYVKAILDAWAKKGIASVADARAEDAAFRRRQEERMPRGGAGKAEVVPVWFREQKREEKRKREQAEAAEGARDSDAEWEEVERLLAKYRSG